MFDRIIKYLQTQKNSILFMASLIAITKFSLPAKPLQVINTSYIVISTINENNR